MALMVLSSLSVALAQEDTELVDDAAADELADELTEDELAELEEELEDEELEQEAADEIVDEDPGAVSGVGLGLKKFFERVDVALTADQREKAEKELEFARRRILEARKAAMDGKDNAAERARKAHEDALAKWQERFGDENTEDSLTARERLRKHLALVRAANNDLDEDDQIDTATIEDRIEARLERARARLKAAGELTDEEIEAEIDLLEAEINDKIDDVSDNIAERLSNYADHVQEIIDKNRARLREFADDADADDELAQKKIEIATESLNKAEELVDEARRHIEAEEYRQARTKLLRAKKLAQSPLLRARLRAALADAEDRLRDRILEEKEDLREKWEERKGQIKEELDRVRVQIGEDLDGEQLRRRLSAARADDVDEIIKRHRVRLVDRDGDGEVDGRVVTDVRIKGDDALIRRNVRGENEDGDKIHRQVGVRVHDGEVVDVKTRSKIRDAAGNEVEEEEESDDTDESDSTDDSDDSGDSNTDAAGNTDDN